MSQLPDGYPLRNPAPRSIRDMLDASKVACPIVVPAFTPPDVAEFERKWDAFSTTLPLPESTPSRKGLKRVRRDAAEVTVVRDAPLITPGKHLAIYYDHRRVWMFRTHKLFVGFRVYHLGLDRPGDVVVLRRHYPISVGPDKRIKGSPHSDFVRELQAVTGRKVSRHDRLSPSGFAKVVVVVLVRTVVRDSHQQPLHETAQYSVIYRVLGKWDRGLWLGDGAGL